jgi:hypothetical protein
MAQRHLAESAKVRLRSFANQKLPIRDEEGQELSGLAAARNEATRGLADLAKDALPGAFRRELSVQVRDYANRDILRAALWFEVAILA